MILDIMNDLSYKFKLMTQEKIKKLISILDSRIKELENELNSKNSAEDSSNDQTGDMKIFKIGEIQGIKLCLLAIKSLLIN